MTECLSRVSQGLGRGLRAAVGSPRAVFSEEGRLSPSAREWVCVGGWGVGGAGLEKEQNKERSPAWARQRQGLGQGLRWD